MELLQLRYFLSAAKTQNFTTTAKIYRVPVSNISQTIKKLENELGTQLFDRLGNRVCINKQGAVFYAHISSAISAIDEGVAAVAKSTARSHETLYLLALSNRDMVSTCIALFHHTCPDVEVIFEHNLQKVNLESADLIISGEDPVFDGFPKLHLLDEDFKIAISRQMLTTVRDEITPETLRKANYITLAKSKSFENALLALGKHYHFTPTITFVCEDPFYVLKYVTDNMGIAYIPSKTWKHRMSPDIALLALPDFKLERHTYLYRNPERGPSNAVEKFMDILQDISRSMQ